MKKILLADHDDSIRKALGEVLVSENYEVIPVATTHEAMKKLFSDRPDLVLLDSNLPDQEVWSVFDLANKIQSGVPIVVITAKSPDRKKISNLGAGFVMEKPLDIPLLLDGIRLCLDRHGAEKIHLADAKTDSEWIY